MPYLIDSDVLIDHLAGATQWTDLLMRLAPEGLAISTVTYMEVLQGCLRHSDYIKAGRVHGIGTRDTCLS